MHVPLSRSAPEQAFSSSVDDIVAVGMEEQPWRAPTPRYDAGGTLTALTLGAASVVQARVKLAGRPLRFPSQLHGKGPVSVPGQEGAARVEGGPW
jgi:hypothetical protein